VRLPLKCALEDLIDLLPTLRVQVLLHE
jgi:hypothetical protein